MTTGQADGSPSALISRGAVQLLAEYTGRGPTKAHTLINRDAIMILLRDALTKGERSLVAMGMGDHVLSTREKYQRAMREDLIALVEGVSGRKVAAFLSANHVEPDIGAEIFVLEPEDKASVDDWAEEAGSRGA
jgi:uncharacterized protein YbcI